MEATLKLDSRISEFDTTQQEREYLAFLHQQVAQGRQSADLTSEQSRQKVRMALAEKRGSHA